MPRQINQLHARRALLPDGWQRDVSVQIEQGRITSVASGRPPSRLGEAAQQCVEILLPAAANLHSHSFQLAFAGRAEPSGGGQALARASQDFWSWRAVMYRWALQLEPEEVEAIAALAFSSMLEAGFAAVAEFHYLHHDPSGCPYADPAELSTRIARAARRCGIGLTLLPVLYSYGGLDEAPPQPEQRRFICSSQTFTQLLGAVNSCIQAGPEDWRIGLAAHSLRAVSAQQIAELPQLIDLLPERAPVHIHVAEQPAEVDAVSAALGCRPVDWLLDHAPVNDTWCLVHATHVLPHEIARIGASGATVGLCPITEANLGDGVFDLPGLLAARGAFGIGSDSNVLISLNQELRTLDYGQRLMRGRRDAMGDGWAHGERLFREALRGGAAALGRASGAIEAGCWADLVALDSDHICFAAMPDDLLLDAWIFAAPGDLVTDVWSAGRHVVQDGRHIHRAALEREARRALERLAAGTPN
jgi:formimidoylglutamate deiminase